MSKQPQANETDEKIRVDKWLWYARVVKTRTLATKLVQSGAVRLNRQKISTAKQPVKPEDVLTIAVHDRVRVLKVLKIGERRGPAPEAQTLYEDLSPPPPKKESDPAKQAEPVIGEPPSKKERRELNKLRGRI